MKNMATELGIILIGYFTLVPAIQVRPGRALPAVSQAPGAPVQAAAGTGSPAGLWVTLPACLCL